MKRSEFAQRFHKFLTKLRGGDISSTLRENIIHQVLFDITQLHGEEALTHDGFINVMTQLKEQARGITMPADLTKILNPGLNPDMIVEVVTTQEPAAAPNMPIKLTADTHYHTFPDADGRRTPDDEEPVGCCGCFGLPWF